MTRRRSLLPKGHGSTRVHEAFASRHLEYARTVTVHLPPGYDADEKRSYPVFYLHDGQNLFDASRAAYGMSWHAGETCDRLVREGRLRPLILVGIDNSPARLDEYGHHRDPGHETGGRAFGYGRFLFEELKPFIDRTYRTLPGRIHTGVGGASMGGLVSLGLARTHYRRFSRCAILSPSLWWARSELLDEVEHDYEWMGDFRFWLCMGTREGRRRGHVSSHLERCRRLTKVFDAAGLLPGKDYVYQEVAGGEHNERAWAARFDKVLLYLFGW